MKITPRKITELITNYLASKFPHHDINTRETINAILSESRFMHLSKCKDKSWGTGELLMSLWGKNAEFHTFWFLKDGRIYEKDGCCPEHCKTIERFISRFIVSNK